MFALRRTALSPLSRRAFSTSPIASSFAKMTIIGRLGDTPELTATSTGNEIIKYVVATSSGPKDNQTTNWFRVTGFIPEGPQREFIGSLEKGYAFNTLFQWEDGIGEIEKMSCCMD